MEVAEVDVASDMALRASYDVDRRAMLVGREGLPHWSWPEMLGSWRHPDPGEKAVLLGGHEGGRMLAAAVLFLPLLDNTDKGWLGVCVDPAEQGRGLGREMLAHLVALAVAEDRTTLLAEAKLPFEAVTTHRYRRFAEAAGFTLSNVEIVRHLPLPVRDGALDAWGAQAAQRHHGYRIETHVDGVPEALVPSLCVLLGQLAVDAPSGEADWEEEVISPERHQENLAGLLAAGRRIHEAVAIAPDGTVAAQSTISVPPAGGGTDASQWGTFVHREHRGRRLGLAVKTANLRVVQQAHPEMRRIVTQNAETNDWMVAINEQMGFEPVEASVEFIQRVERT